VPARLGARTARQEFRFAHHLVLHFSQRRVLRRELDRTAASALDALDSLLHFGYGRFLRVGLNVQAKDLGQIGLHLLCCVVAQDVHRYRVALGLGNDVRALPVIGAQRKEHVRLAEVVHQNDGQVQVTAGLANLVLVQPVGQDAQRTGRAPLAHPVPHRWHTRLHERCRPHGLQVGLLDGRARDARSLDLAGRQATSHFGLQRVAAQCGVDRCGDVRAHSDTVKRLDLHHH